MKDSWRPPFRCSQCDALYPDRGFPHCCPGCGGIFDHPLPWSYQAPDAEKNGLAKYAQILPFPPDFDPGFCSLGEGNTPLIGLTIGERQVHLKCEYLNPSGSFKDRGSFMLVASLIASAVQEAVEDSSGNAGASFAAYSRRVGIEAKIFVPAYASGPKKDQITAYGANLVRVEGARAAASDAVLREVEKGLVYASHAHQPHVLSGMGTLAYELFEKLGQAPGAVVLPVGQGTLLLGIERAFRTLINHGFTDRMPQLIGVQAAACAPLRDMAQSGLMKPVPEYEGQTLAEGVRITNPLRGGAVIEAIYNSAGTIAVVEEPKILEGRDALARRGFYIEPTSAIVWQALLDHLEDLPDPVVVILTGSGLKV